MLFLFKLLAFDAPHDERFGNQQDSDEHQGKTNGMYDYVVDGVAQMFMHVLDDTHTYNGGGNTAAGQPESDFDIYAFLAEMHDGAEGLRHG